MTHGRRAAWVDAGVGVALAALAGCVPASPPVAALPNRAPEAIRDLPERPPVAVVVRDGDPRAALSVAVLTAGVDDAAGPRVPVALAGVTEARLAAAGVRDVTVSATWDGYRVRALVAGKAEALPLVHALREALLAPVQEPSTELDVAARRLTSLAQRPLHDPALVDAARCGELPSAIDHDPPVPPPGSIERWRAASDGLGRVVFGAVGTASDVDAITAAVLSEPAWPVTARTTPRPAPTAPLAVYEERDLPAGAARVSLVLHGGSAEAIVAAAPGLASLDSALSTRLRSLDFVALVNEVVATVEPGGGCLRVTLDLPREGRRKEAESIATAATAALHEVRLAATADPGLTPRTAALAGDPRAAAELAAWWTLLGRADAPRTDVVGSVAVGLGPAADGAELGARTTELASAFARIELAAQNRGVEARTAVEHGQGTVWVLLGSPCGVLAEGESDAGLTALAVGSLAEAARSRGSAELAEWVTAEGVGLTARATRHPGETTPAFTLRLADALATAFLTNAVDGSAIARARTELMTALRGDDARAFAILAEALTPGHPSWASPFAGGQGLDRWPDGAVVARIAALRREPLRVAVLGNDDEGAANAVVQAIDRWVPRSANAARACAPHAPSSPAKPGTYVAPSSSDAAWLALPLPNGTRDVAVVVAAALDGSEGLLARALSSGLASGWSARVVGPKEAAALVVRVVAPGPLLDAAVAQVRALLDRLRQGALTEADRTYAGQQLERATLAATLDPRERLVRLWRGDGPGAPLPSLDTLRAFLGTVVHDEALLIVAARPPAAKPAP